MLLKFSISPFISARFIDVATYESYSFNTVWIQLVNTTSGVFRVSACKDAHVLLSGAMYDSANASYDIHIGAGIIFTYFSQYF